ncbi:hypothetical protein [Sinorhizobium sp. NFACC03]|nr:hypothetical protein [Sinorhizobium sp. NFACC03]
MFVQDILMQIGQTQKLCKGFELIGVFVTNNSFGGIICGTSQISFQVE